MVRGVVQDLAQQGQRDRPLVFQGIPVERDEDGHQVAHVARRAGQQVIQRARRQGQGPRRGLRRQGGLFFPVGQRGQAVNQARAEAGAQVLAQRQALRRLSGRGEQAPAGGAQPVEQVEQGDLPGAGKRFDVVDGDARRRVAGYGDLFQVGRRDGVVVGGRAGAQQVREPDSP